MNKNIVLLKNIYPKYLNFIVVHAWIVLFLILSKIQAS